MRNKAAVLDSFNWRKTGEHAGVRTFSHPLHPGHKIRVIEDQWTHEGPGDYSMEHGTGGDSLQAHCESFHHAVKSESDNEIIKSMTVAYGSGGFQVTTFTEADGETLRKSIGGRDPELTPMTIRRYGHNINPSQQIAKGVFQDVDVTLWLTRGAKLELRTRVQKAVFERDPKVHPDAMIEFDAGTLRESNVVHLFRDATLTPASQDRRSPSEIRKSENDTAGARMRAAAEALDDLVTKGE